MAFKGSENLKYIFSTIKSSFLPALFLLFGLVMFYSENPYEGGVTLFLHFAFLFVILANCILLYITNRSKPMFSLLTGFAAYLIINHLKVKYGESFISAPEFQCLCFVLPLNLILFNFLPQSKLNTYHNAGILLFLLLQACILQHCCQIFQIIPYVDITVEAMPLWACAIWAIAMVPLIISMSYRNTILNTGMFYAFACIAVGTLQSATLSGLATFYLGFALILLCATILDLYKQHTYDYLEHVYSKKAYTAHSNSKFPFKYTVALFGIDNRDKLLQVIGDKKMRNLEQMVINSIIGMPYELTVYRYNENELIMVFKNENAKHVKEFADNIRRNIAASTFILADGRNLKITISVCVSEKTRKDRNPLEVIDRAHESLQKSYRFNSNIITVA